MPDLNDVRRLLTQEYSMGVVNTVQKGGDVLSSVASVGVTNHPVTGEPRVALVSEGGAARLGHIRRGSTVTVTVRRGATWAAVTGPAEIIGPDDPADGIDGERLRLLLREVYQAAGGSHDDWDEYDRVMAENHRAAVFVAPDRILGVA